MINQLLQHIIVGFKKSLLCSALYLQGQGEGFYANSSDCFLVL